MTITPFVLEQLGSPAAASSSSTTDAGVNMRPKSNPDYRDLSDDVMRRQARTLIPLAIAGSVPGRYAPSPETLGEIRVRSREPTVARRKRHERGETMREATWTVWS